MTINALDRVAKMLADLHIMKFNLRKLSLVVAASLALGLLSVHGAESQIPGGAQQPPRRSAVTTPALPVAIDSPRASLRAYFEAARAGRWQDAARYLSLDDDQRSRGVELAARLKGVLDVFHWVDLETVSAEPSGQRDDGLPPELEEVGRMTVIKGRAEPLRLVRTSDAQGEFWAFSPSTVERIDAWYGALPDRWLRDVIIYAGVDDLLRPGPYEILWWQWIALPVLVLGAWVLGRGLSRLTRLVLRRLAVRTATEWDDRFLACIAPPLTLVWAVSVFSVGLPVLALTAPAGRFLDSIITAGIIFALFWAIWRSAGVLAERLMQFSWATQSASARSLLAFGNNLARGAIFVIGLLAVLTALGYPVGTLLAGLGIGGLALAFGAQKTVENLFGSISLAVDQPFRVGDFVKIEEFVGTVEDIGLRSTRIRTLDRTLISIPNGKLADQRLESFQARDRMRLATTLGVTYSTTRSQMQAVLEGLERVLRSHPHIWPDAMVVKFKEFGPSSLDIEIMAWFQVPTWGDFQRCRQEVLLGFMQVVEDAGTSFAFPTRTVHLVQEGTDGREPA